jgi:hypothetical protein
MRHSRAITQGNSQTNKIEASRSYFNPFVTKQLLFYAYQPARAMACKPPNAVARYNPVARNDNRNRVGPTGVANGLGAGSEAPRQGAIGANCSHIDALQRTPDSPLEFGTAQTKPHIEVGSGVIEKGLEPFHHQPGKRFNRLDQTLVCGQKNHPAERARLGNNTQPAQR